MPFLGADDDQRLVGSFLHHAIRGGTGFLERARLDGLALLVEAVERGGDARRFVVVVGRQQLGAQRGIADASAGIDARAQNEAQMIGGRLLAQARGVGQRLEADILAAGHDGEALGDIGAVETDERHDVGHCRQRDEVEVVDEGRLGDASGVDAALSQLARDGDEREEHDARGAEVALAGDVVEAVRIDEGVHGGQALIGLMVVDDDDIGAELGRAFENVEAGRAAVDGDDELGAVTHEAFEGGGVGAVAFGEAVGDVDAVRHAVMRQEARQQRRRAGAVDVVVAEDGDLLALGDGVGDAASRLVHVGEARRVRHQGLDGRVEEQRHGIERHAARGEHAAQELRQIVLLADGERRFGSRMSLGSRAICSRGRIW